MPYYNLVLQVTPAYQQHSSNTNKIYKMGFSLLEINYKIFLAMKNSL
jgi:hypothetical protein